MEFKDKLKKIRIQNGLTQKDLAEKLICTRSAVAKWENGLGMPNEDSFNRLCEVFNVEKNDLLSDQIEEANITKNKRIFFQKRIIISLISFSTILIVGLIITIIVLSNRPKYVTLHAPEGKLNGIVSNYNSGDIVIDLNRVGENFYIVSATAPQKFEKDVLKNITVIEKKDSYIFESNNLNDYKYDVNYAFIDNDYNYITTNEKTSFTNYIDDIKDKINWYVTRYNHTAKVDKDTHKFSIPENENMIIVLISGDMKFEIEDKTIIRSFKYYFILK